MPITIAENAGFCFGVKRATDFTESLILKNPRARIFTVGTLIHNPQFNAALAEKSVTAIHATDVNGLLSERTDDSLPYFFVIRTHGITKEEHELLLCVQRRYPNVHIEDMTCPFVKRIHDIAKRETSEETLFILLGTPTHPEVLGIMSYARGEKVALSSYEEIKKHLSLRQNDEKKLVLAAQTTQNLQEWKKTQKFIEKLYTNAKIFDTICNVTENRQKEAERLSRDADRMIVVGGKESSNTKKLYELCKANCPDCVWIETASELPENYKTDATKKVAIAAGASTPSGIILEVYKSMENFEQMLEESLKTLHTGETVNGIVTAIANNVVYVDLGAKVTGVIDYDQITDEPNVDLRTLVSVGDEIRVFVIRVDDGKGVATLSKKRVDSDKAWEDVIALEKSGEIFEGKVTDVIKGGVLMSAGGFKVFVPASQTGYAKGEDFSALAGTTQKARIIEVDKFKKRAIASIRSVQSEIRKAAEAAIRATLEVGQHFTGTVKNLTNYGAFVDIGGVDGMVHNTELSWKRIKHPSQVVSVGQEIEVFIKEIDAESGRISLGYKTEEMDDFYQFTKDHNVGDVVEAKIVNMMPFGAFAEVAPGVDGLIHISKISLEKIAKPEDVLTIGQIVTVKITEIDKENRKLSLSIRALLDEARRAEEKAAYEAEKAERLAAKKAADEEEAQLRAEMAPYIVKTID